MVKFITKSVCMALVAVLCVGSLNAQMVSSRLGATPQDHVKSPPRPPATKDILELGYCDGNLSPLNGNYVNGTVYISGCISFTAGQMANYVGGDLFAIEVGVPPLEGSQPFMTDLISFRVWVKTALNGAVVLEDDIPLTDLILGDFNLFTLSSPWTIAEEPLVFGFTAGFTTTEQLPKFPLWCENEAAPYPTGAFMRLASTNVNGHGAGASWSSSTEEALGVWGYVEGDPLPANDLSALGVNPTTTSLKWVGTSATYNVTVQNAGTAPQNNFTVQLLDASDAVLGTQTVTNTLQPGASTNVTFNHTLTTPGFVELKGKVILSGDTNPDNDISEPFTQRVYPQQPMAYCDHRSLGGVGAGASVKHQAAIQYPTTIEGKLTTIEVGFGVPASTLSGCKVWIANALTPTINPLYEQEFTPTEDGWSIVELTTPYELTGAEVYIGWTATSTQNYIIGCTNNAPINTAYGGHLQYSTQAWTTMQAAGLSYNNAIIGVIKGDCDPPENVKVEYTPDCVAKITWDPPTSKDDVLYNVYRDGVAIATEITETFFDDEDFNQYNPHAWCVEVVCEKSSSMQACVNKEACDGGDPPPCNPIADLTVEFEKDCSAATLNWTAAADMPGATYNIYRGITKIASEWTETTYVDEGIEANQEYIWSVRTICLDNIEAPIVSVEGTCKPVGINELANSVLIYPNPTSGTITINMEGFSKVEIYNTVGQLIETKTVETFDVASYNTGIYFFKVYDVYNNNVTKRVMVSR